MRTLLAALVLAPSLALMSGTAWADEPKPTKPPTVEQLQKQVAFLSAALQDVTAQRDAYRSQLDNLQVQIDAQKKVDGAK